MGILTGIIAFIILLPIIVFVHEYGHFLFARINGVCVESFSIGFGPSLFEWKDKHNTVWKISAIPLGGYVKMLGQSDTTESAKEKAEKWNIPTVQTVDGLLANGDVEIVVNLTPPKFHYEITKKALLAGKNVYTEKPLAETAKDAEELVALAEERGLLLGCAPETNYGASVSTAKALLDSGAIGKVLYADARFRGPGDENWHPNPAFLYQEGAGPLFDRGPYFLTDLIYLLGIPGELIIMLWSVITKKPTKQ